MSSHGRCYGGYVTTPAYLLPGALVAPGQDQLLCPWLGSVHVALLLFLSSPELEKKDVPNSLQFPGNSIFLPHASPSLSLSPLPLLFSPHNPSSMCASSLLLLLCCAAHICHPPHPYPCPALSIHSDPGPCSSHLMPPGGGGGGWGGGCSHSSFLLLNL